jgi:hypothetical protein
MGESCSLSSSRRANEAGPQVSGTPLAVRSQRALPSSACAQPRYSIGRSRPFMTDSSRFA